MSENIQQIKKFVALEMEDVVTDIVFYYNEQICVPPKDKGILYGKKMAYQKIWDFIEEMEETQKENK